MRIKTLINRLIDLERENGNITVCLDDWHYSIHASVHNPIKTVKVKMNKFYKNGKYILIKGA